MGYGTPKTFKKIGDIKTAWEEFTKPYIDIDVATGKRVLKDKAHVPFDYEFAVYCGCSIQTLWNYANKADYKDFHEECEKITTDYTALMMQSSLAGNNNANFIMSRKLGFIEINKIKMEEDKESIALLEKFNRMDNAEFKEEFKKYTK